MNKKILCICSGIMLSSFCYDANSFSIVQEIQREENERTVANMNETEIKGVSDRIASQAGYIATNFVDNMTDQVLGHVVDKFVSAMYSRVQAETFSEFLVNVPLRQLKHYADSYVKQEDLTKAHITTKDEFRNYTFSQFVENREARHALTNALTRAAADWTLAYWSKGGSRDRYGSEWIKDVIDPSFSLTASYTDVVKKLSYHDCEHLLVEKVFAGILGVDGYRYGDTYVVPKLEATNNEAVKLHWTWGHLPKDIRDTTVTGFGVYDGMIYDGKDIIPGARPAVSVATSISVSPSVGVVTPTPGSIKFLVGGNTQTEISDLRLTITLTKPLLVKDLLALREKPAYESNKDKTISVTWTPSGANGMDIIAHLADAPATPGTKLEHCLDSLMHSVQKNVSGTYSNIITTAVDLDDLEDGQYTPVRQLPEHFIMEWIGDKLISKIADHLV